MSSATIVLTASLGSSALTLIGAFGLQWQRGRQIREEGARKSLVVHCASLNSHALMYVARVQALYEYALIRSGLREGLDVALHHRAPADVLEISAWLFLDLEPMFAAQAQIELRGSERLIRSASDVVVGALEVQGIYLQVSETGTDTQSSDRNYISGLVDRLRSAKRNPSLESSGKDAIMKLGRVIREFEQVVREELDHGDPDAVLRAFPKLFASADVEANNS